MIENNDSNEYFSFFTETETLSILPKTILLEEGKVADRLYLIRKGCLRLFFYNEGKDMTFQFFLKGILLHHSTAYTNGNRVFSFWKVLNLQKYR